MRYLLEYSWEYFGDESWIDLSILSVHGEGFSWPSLSIGKDGGVISFEWFIDEMVYLTFVIEIVLRGVLVEDIVEIEIFDVVSIVYLYFFSLLMCGDAGVGVSIFDLVFQEGSDTYGGFDFAAHE